MELRVPSPRTVEQLEACVAAIAAAPADAGILRMIVRRPEPGAREVLDHGELDVQAGLRGDNWISRGSSRTADRTAHPDMQLTLMNARVIAALAPDEAMWPLAGDQLFVDFDLSETALPTGTRIQIGSAVIEVTDQPHTGCKKFAERFGVDATKFINSPVGRKLRMRGVNTKVVRSGSVRVGDEVSKVEA